MEIVGEMDLESQKVQDVYKRQVSGGSWRNYGMGSMGCR